MSSKARFLCICWLGSTQKRIRNLVKHLWGAFLRKNIKELIKAVSYICIKAPSRSSHRRCFIVLQNSKENTCIEAWEKETPKRLQHMCFLVNFAKFLRQLFYRTPVGDCFCISGMIQMIELISGHWPHSRPPKNIKKPLVFWCLQRVTKEISGMKWFNYGTISSLSGSSMAHIYLCSIVVCIFLPCAFYIKLQEKFCKSCTFFGKQYFVFLHHIRIFLPSLGILRCFFLL